jgi:hypothetical protein
MQEDNVLRFRVFIQVPANLFGPQAVHGVKA